jgi:hypothetical protein
MPYWVMLVAAFKAGARNAMVTRKILKKIVFIGEGMNFKNHTYDFFLQFFKSAYGQSPESRCEMDCA